ncbi:MAG: MFS transporter [Pseudomonadota bacterium]
MTHALGEEARAAPRAGGALGAIWALFLGVGLLMIGNGLQGSLLGLRAGDAFSGVVSGMIMAGFFAGFFVGSVWTVGAVRRVGHIRVFAALAAMASITVLVHGVFLDPVLWTLLRFVTGVCFAGIFVVAESWLNDAAGNDSRGRLLSFYMMISWVCMAGGQALLPLARPDEIELFVLVSVVISFSVVPLLLSAAAAPAPAGPQTVALRAVYRASPLGVVGVFVSGMVNGSVFGMGAVYAQEAGLDVLGVSAFMGALIAGAAALQWPLGKLSDLMDRRLVIASGAFAAAALALAANAVEASGWAHLAFAAGFGGSALSLYSLSLAYTNDYLAPTEMVGASGALVLVLGAGSVAGPLVVGAVLDTAGASGFFTFLAAILALFGGFALYRMTRRAPLPAEAQGPYVAVPTTGSSVMIEIAEAAHAEQVGPDAPDGAAPSPDKGSPAAPGSDARS